MFLKLKCLVTTLKHTKMSWICLWRHVLIKVQVVKFKPGIKTAKKAIMNVKCETLSFYEKSDCVPYVFLYCNKTFFTIQTMPWMIFDLIEPVMYESIGEMAL